MPAGDGRAISIRSDNRPGSLRLSVAMNAADRSAEWPGMMQAAQDGDQRAYARLLTEILPVTRAMVRRRISDPQLADEAVQDTLLTLHRVRHTYDPARPFLPWLAAIASARALDQLRRQGRRAQREVYDETAMLNHADEPGESAHDAREAREELARMLDQLPPQQRRAVELVKLQEMSLAEASALTSQSVGALKVTIHRALKALRGRQGDRR